MTIDDYSTIQRQLGFIEGVAYTLNNDLYDAILDATSTIENIIDKEMVSNNNEIK